MAEAHGPSHWGSYQCDFNNNNISFSFYIGMPETQAEALVDSLVQIMQVEMDYMTKNMVTKPQQASRLILFLSTSVLYIDP